MTNDGLISRAEAVDKDMNVPNNDCISRQAAVDIVYEIDTFQAGWRTNAMDQIKALQSAQPEIIMCKDCKHFIRSNASNWTVCNKYNGLPYKVDGTDFCGRAERKTDE